MPNSKDTNLKSSSSSLSLLLAGFFLFVCLRMEQIATDRFPNYQRVSLLSAAFSLGPSSLDVSLMNNYELVSNPLFLVCH